VPVQKAAHWRNCRCAAGEKTKIDGDEKPAASLVRWILIPDAETLCFDLFAEKTSGKQIAHTARYGFAQLYFPYDFLLFLELRLKWTYG